MGISKNIRITDTGEAVARRLQNLLASQNLDADYGIAIMPRFLAWTAGQRAVLELALSFVIAQNEAYTVQDLVLSCVELRKRSLVQN